MRTMDTRRGITDTGTFFRVERGRGKEIRKKRAIRCYAYFLGDKIICTPNPRDMKFTYIRNMRMYP